MKPLLSLLVITKNSGSLLEKSLSSAAGLVNEIIVVDDGSTDNTLSIAKKFNAVIFKNHEENLGNQRALGLSKCQGEWVLMLDADEVVSGDLKKEIQEIISRQSDVAGYYIPYQNHFLGKAVYYGGENYKILRLFKKSNSVIPENVIHEHVKVKGKLGLLNGKIYHYSYRSLCQTFRKFTDYARREATRKTLNGEKTTIWKLVSYPPHMFWARYIKDKGYKDYFLCILLDLGFAYMEFLTYLFMFFPKHISKKN